MYIDYLQSYSKIFWDKFNPTGHHEFRQLTRMTNMNSFDTRQCQSHEIYQSNVMLSKV